MIKSLLLVFGVLSVCAVGVVAVPVQEKEQAAQDDQPPAVVRNFDWSKTFDASIEMDPKRRMLARQYAALMPLAEKMKQLFLRERIPALAIFKLEVKQLEIRYQLETKLQDRKECLEVLVFHLNTIQEAQHFLMEQPPRPGKSGRAQMGQEDFQDLINATLKTVKWESELEQLNDQLAAKKKK